MAPLRPSARRRRLLRRPLNAAVVLSAGWLVFAPSWVPRDRVLSARVAGVVLLWAACVLYLYLVFGRSRASGYVAQGDERVEDRPTEVPPVSEAPLAFAAGPVRHLVTAPGWMMFEKGRWFGRRLYFCVPLQASYAFAQVRPRDDTPMRDSPITGTPQRDKGHDKGYDVAQIYLGEPPQAMRDVLKRAKNPSAMTLSGRWLIATDFPQDPDAMRRWPHEQGDIVLRIAQALDAEYARSRTPAGGPRRNDPARNEWWPSPAAEFPAAEPSPSRWEQPPR